MKRRRLLSTLAILPLATLGGTLRAAPATKSRLLLVFLRGGYDASNLLVPVSSKYYYEARPSIAIAAPGTGPNAALRLDTNWGLHPALEESIFPLFQRGQVAFIPFAGTDDISRSHFETQDTIELGQAPGGSRNDRSGFLNRLADTLGAAPLSFTDQLPLIMQGSMQVSNMALRTLAQPQVDQRQSAIITSM